MAKTTTLKTAEELDVPLATPPKRKVYTRWDAFDALNLVPTEIQCQTYPSVHAVDVSCHSRLNIVDAKTMITHYLNGHGGGYIVKVRVGDSPWKGWQELADAGVELADFRCGECLQPVRISPNDIQAHMRPHLAGKRMKSSEVFLMTIHLESAPKFDGFDEE